ncbi:substrate-binding periplasmic protein [Paraburkholderia bannensis]|uniref:substrate-binding periplasmic protein n=1 Tax=Paraburkholderia bannensis TaxID=765414 RepID=UPI002ABD718E|nr:transporter substrate-binding domain-containing protein [Paraburkholderia bannensis]
MSLSFSIRRCVLVLAASAGIGALFIGPAAHAAGDAPWQKVRADGVLRCGAAASPPYVIRDPQTQSYEGAFADLCRGFAERLKVKAVFVDATWPNLIAGLQSDKWDMALSLSDTPEREKAVSFSAPVFDSSVTFAYDKRNPKLASAPHSMADLNRADLTLSVMAGSVADKAISDVLTKPHIMRLPDADAARLALLSKRADILADDIATNMLVTAAHPESLVAFKPEPALAPLPANFGVSKALPAADLAYLNSYIDEQKKAGAVDRMMAQAVKKTLQAAK